MCEKRTTLSYIQHDHTSVVLLTTTDRRAVDAAEERGGERSTAVAKVWHDNEKFLIVPKAYKAAGLKMVRFPPNGGDINPIENVWAWLRRDLATRELEDLSDDVVLTVAQFRARASQILQSYSVPKKGEEHSRLQRLVRGMPRRLKRCRENGYGRSGM